MKSKLNQLAIEAENLCDEEFYAALGTIYRLLKLEEPTLEAHMD